MAGAASGDNGDFGLFGRISGSVAVNDLVLEVKGEGRVRDRERVKRSMDQVRRVREEVFGWEYMRLAPT
jgi:hypothetical protein